MNGGPRRVAPRGRRPGRLGSLRRYYGVTFDQRRISEQVQIADEVEMDVSASSPA